MKQKSIILLILFFSQFFYAQNINKGIISYNVSINTALIDYSKINKGIDDKTVAKQMIDLYKKQEIKIYKLYFNKRNSYFDKESSLQNEGGQKDLVAVHAGNGKFYYNSITKETIEQKSFEGKQYLINIPKIKWHLTKESKRIGKYICFKATATKIIESMRGKANRKVIAWYAPKIPLSFGPNEFNGLPGLILELEEGLALFKVSKINLKPKKKIVINKPTKGKNISLQEYHLIVRLAAEKFNTFKGSLFQN